MTCFKNYSEANVRRLVLMRYFECSGDFLRKMERKSSGGLFMDWRVFRATRNVSFNPFVRLLLNLASSWFIDY